jgi:hypothetical protein
LDTVTDTRGGSNAAPRLLPQHLADLRKSGLTDAQIAACGFYSETDPRKVIDLLGTHFKPKAVAALGPCLVIPYIGPDGAPLGYARLKPDNPRKDRRKGGKVVKYEGPAGKPNRAYVPPGIRAALAGPAVPLLLTEGEKKGAAADQHGFACVALAGVWAWQVKREKDARGRGTGPRQLLPDLAAVAWQGRAVFIAFDSDAADKPEIRWAEWHLAEALRTAGADVRVVRLPGGAGGEKVGLDDFLLARGPDALRALLAAAVAPAPPVETDSRPQIVIDTDEYRVNGEAAAALASESDLYQRAGMLVQVVGAEPAAADAPVRRAAGTLVLREVPPPLLRERLTRCARWARYGGGDDEEFKPVHPPGWAVNAVHARGDWLGVRRLEAVVNHPVVLGDGALLAANGYDPRSRLLVCVPPDLALSVPARPTPADVRAAVAAIGDVLRDFPFECPAHRAAWFAGLLTPLAWFAFEGPAPLLLIDANTRGAGKGLLADVAALILTGRRFPVMAYTADKEELRKKVTSLAMEGERLVLLDNLAGAVGNDVLDMALTTDRWKDRVLGGNRVFDGPLHVTWFATGNNVQLAADTARRCSHCRLETPEERPELRTDVTHPNLRAHVRRHRGPLLSAALTVLRGWHAAGRPAHGLAPWGSFEGWSAVVREAVVFAGLPDPGETRLALQTSADRDAAAMEAVLACLEQMDPGRRGVTTAEVVERAKGTTGPVPEWAPGLRAAVEELCGKLDGRALGGRFRHFQKRNFGGRMLVKGGADRTNANRWEVVPVGARTARAETPPSPPASPAAASVGDEGDAGPVPAAAEPRRAKKRYRSDDRPHDGRAAA